MIFKETYLKGAFVIEVEKLIDDRGFFGRLWCKEQFDNHGLNTDLVQSNVSLSHNKGTLRGMHFQKHPFQETKLVRCTKGAVYDVIIDLRPDSDTFKKWFGIELSEENHKMIYVPENFAHGFLTLKDNSEVYYLVTQFYNKSAEFGVRWDDPVFDIKWPTMINEISDKDAQHPNFDLKNIL
jgi:dTDP-4-dehydrorhamnose 3,5-epimerase